MSDTQRWENAFQSAMVGWDFSILDGRMTSDEPDWDFEADCLAAMTHASRCLDLGTGGGERLIRLIKSLGDRGDRVIVATEGWEPNVPVARENLSPHGIDVRQYDAEAGDRLPFEDGSFDLIMSRHEAVDFGEIARVLSPGGRFITQQVSGFDVPEIHEWFGADYDYPNVTMSGFVRQARDAGLAVTVVDEWEGRMVFDDVEALLTYLGLVPWDVPEGFAVADHLETLESLERSKPITVTQRRFRVYCELGESQ